MTYDLQDRFFLESEQTESSQSTCQNSNADTRSLQQELKSCIFETDCSYVHHDSKFRVSDITKVRDV